jgi:hypothetical protein
MPIRLGGHSSCSGAHHDDVGANRNLADINRAASKITVQGVRYPEHLQKLVGRRMAVHAAMPLSLEPT